MEKERVKERDKEKSKAVTPKFNKKHFHETPPVRQYHIKQCKHNNYKFNRVTSVQEQPAVSLNLFFQLSQP